MKPFKTIGSFCLAASALLLVTSCTKTMDEQLIKPDNETEKLAAQVGNRCGRFIGMTMRHGVGRFWYEDFNNATFFTGNDWSDETLMRVSTFANGNGVNWTQPFYSGLPEEALGVTSNIDNPANQEVHRINMGEILRLEIGNGFPAGVKMYGFDLNINASRLCQGVVRMFDGNTLVATYNFTGVGKMVKNFGISYRTNDGTFFTRMEFSTTAGAFRINGFPENQTNPLVQPPARFYVVDLPNFANYNNRLQNPEPYPFFTSTLSGVRTAAADYQLRTNLPEGAAGSGVFDQGTKEWVKLTGTASGPNVGLTYRAGSLAIRTTVEGTDNTLPRENGNINPGEIFTIEAGADLPFKFFRTFEVRVAHPPANAQNENNPLMVKLWNGATQVGGGLTSGIDRGYNVFFSTVDFNRVTVEGTGPGAAIGRSSDAAIRLTRGCAP